jgi:hypothetical protein
MLITSICPVLASLVVWDIVPCCRGVVDSDLDDLGDLENAGINGIRDASYVTHKCGVADPSWNQDIQLGLLQD